MHDVHEGLEAKSRDAHTKRTLMEAMCHGEILTGPVTDYPYWFSLILFEKTRVQKRLGNGR